MRARLEHIATLVKRFFPEAQLTEKKIRMSRNTTVIRLRIQAGSVAIETRSGKCGEQVF